MRIKLSTIAAVSISSLILIGCQQAQEDTPATLDSNIQKASYLIGLNSTKQISANGLELDNDAFINGIRDGLKENESRIPDDEAQAVLAEYQAYVEKQVREKQEALAAKNLAEAEAYLAENAKAEGVESTESGIQYKILTAGDGDKPVATDIVRVHYEGKLITGEVFDSSYQRNQPAQFALNQVIPGWTEALQLMPAGSTWEITIPPQLGYGAGGAGGQIGPNSALIFKVELIAINPEPEAAPEEEAPE